MTLARVLSDRRRMLASLRRFGRSDQVVLSIMAVVIGVAGGGAAIGFRYAIDAIQWLGFGYAGEALASHAETLDWWLLLLVPSLGGLLVGLFIHRFLPNGQPQGVANVMEATALYGGRMSMATGLRAAVASAASIGCGASVGREGPVVHLGAVVGSWLALRFHLGRRLTRTLLGCGVAAAVAASFNAPIAGVFFALEVVVGHYALSAFAPIVIAGVVGTLVSRMHFGDYPAFVLDEQFQIVSFWEFPAFALLGAVAAVVAIVFIRSVAVSQKGFARLPGPTWIRPAVAGLLVGMIALLFPQVLGVGYEATDKALGQQYTLELLIALAVVKMAATAISLGGGFGGGVFSPSLFVGAMTGGAFGLIAAGAFPHLASDHGAYTIVGMGAVAGAVLGAPISTILMVFELTGDYEITIALMVATAIASVVVKGTFGRSFFQWQLAQRDVDVGRGQEATLLAQTKVRSLLDRSYAAVAPDSPLEEIKRELARAPCSELLVVDGEGALIGVITFTDIAAVAFDGEVHEELTAAKLARNAPLLTAEEDLQEAVRVFVGSGEPHLAVVDSREDRRLLGLVHEHEVMAAYQRVLARARAEERGER
ncbi:chloride channel protein [Algihabitans sp.]|uniref:chloride channel protein n=1 Tax=Algihabitans sp. TaxID=2821514 RepID=UPI003BA936BA